MWWRAVLPRADTHVSLDKSKMNKSKETSQEVLTTILDSKHIVTTNISMYDIKVVDCGDYAQVYLYQDKQARRLKQEKSLELELKKIELNQKLDITETNSNSKETNLSNNIEKRSIIRSKLECQRLAKTNFSEWETFITLTFSNNVTDIKEANKQFRYFIDKVQRVKKDFKYLCVPEFQKRGAVHYHVLTNININDKKLIITQEDNQKFKHIKYWNCGFTSVEVIKGDAKKIIGYISKYMTKDIDNRLFNRHRYFYSRNLKTPKANFINLDNKKDKDYYEKIIQDKEIIYQNDYINPYDNYKVIFLELFKK